MRVQVDKFIYFITSIRLARYSPDIWYKRSAIHRGGATICLADFKSKSLTPLPIQRA